MAEIERETKRYPMDMTEAKWHRIKALLSRTAKRGQWRSVDLREIMNAILYLVRPQAATGDSRHEIAADNAALSRDRMHLQLRAPF